LPAGYHHAMLVGRAAEQRKISRLLTQAQRGQSGVLVITGEPGVGKTALLEQARRRRAGGWTVLKANGVEAEVELPFAGLSELLQPITGGLANIPKPQAAALAGALALRPAAPADHFTIYAGTLSLIALAASHNPVLLLINDPHWLDRSSQNANRLRVPPAGCRKCGSPGGFAARAHESVPHQRTAADETGWARARCGRTTAGQELFCARASGGCREAGW
jgi:hypothetical protein